MSHSFGPRMPYSSRNASNAARNPSRSPSPASACATAPGPCSNRAVSSAEARTRRERSHRPGAGRGRLDVAQPGDEVEQHVGAARRGAQLRRASPGPRSRPATSSRAWRRRCRARRGTSGHRPPVHRRTDRSGRAALGAAFAPGGCPRRSRGTRSGRAPLRWSALLFVAQASFTSSGCARYGGRVGVGAQQSGVELLDRHPHAQPHEPHVREVQVEVAAEQARHRGRVVGQLARLRTRRTRRSPAASP